MIFATVGLGACATCWWCCARHRPGQGIAWLTIAIWCTAAAWT